MNMSMYERPGWDQVFLKIVEYLGKMSTCDRGRVACLITKDNRIISTGYAGSPAGQPHCDDIGHLMIQTRALTVSNMEDAVISEHCIRTIHAEVNAIAQAAKFGVSLNGSTLYCTYTPCFNCAKLIVQAGIKRVVFRTMYQTAEKSVELFNASNIIIEQR